MRELSWNLLRRTLVPSTFHVNTDFQSEAAMSHAGGTHSECAAMAAANPNDPRLVHDSKQVFLWIKLVNELRTDTGHKDWEAERIRPPRTRMVVVREWRRHDGSDGWGRVPEPLARNALGDS